MYIFYNLGSYVAIIYYGFRNMTRRLIHKVIDLKQLYLVVCHIKRFVKFYVHWLHIMLHTPALGPDKKYMTILYYYTDLRVNKSHLVFSSGGFLFTMLWRSKWQQEQIICPSGTACTFRVYGRMSS